MTEDLYIAVRSDTRLLRTIRAAVRGYLEAAETPADRCDEVVLALDEACANSMRHAYKGQTGGRLELTVRREGGAVEFQLRDFGVPIPADKCTPRALTAPDPAQLTPGGLGLPLIFEVFDEVEVCPGVESGNCITMRLHGRLRNTE